VVTNVAAFGAFVDVGVHQDGLVHVSAMSRNFVKDPRDVVKSGDVVRVKVMDVDIPRKRISLTLRLDDEPQGGPATGQQRNSAQSRNQNQPRGQKGGGRPDSRPAAGGSMADALRRAGFDKDRD
jgi:uncharacterized protein